MALPMYADLNILWKSSELLPALLNTSIDLGFQRVAINNYISSLQSTKGKKHASKLQATVLPPSDVLLDEVSLKTVKARLPKFEQFSRLTAVLEDATNTHRLSSPEVQAYDIIAVQPMNEKTFQLACSTLEIDIICLNFTENLGFTPRRPLIKLAIKRGIHFEIIYSPALKDNSVKRSIISNAMSFITVSKGKSIIINSGAENPIDLRSPSDVINLGKLFGLSPSQAKDAVSRNGRAVLKHSETRKTCKSVISVCTASQLAPNEQWILQSSRTEMKNKHVVTPEEGVVTSDDEDSEEESEESDTETEDGPSEIKRKRINLDDS